jgi:hypothetical protein
MQTTQKFRTSFLAIILGISLMPTSSQATSPKEIALYSTAGFAALSFFTYHRAYPYDGPSRYNIEALKQALKELRKGVNVKKNLNIIRKNLYYLYIDGVCGHASRVGSPRFNDKTGKHEIPYVESRGIFGWIGDMMDPVQKTAEAIGKGGLFYFTVKAGKEGWQNYFDTGFSIKALEDASKNVKPSSSK